MPGSQRLDTMPAKDSPKTQGIVQLHATSIRRVCLTIDLFPFRDLPRTDDDLYRFF